MLISGKGKRGEKGSGEKESEPFAGNASAGARLSAMKPEIRVLQAVAGPVRQAFRASPRPVFAADRVASSRRTFPASLRYVGETDRSREGCLFADSP